MFWWAVPVGFTGFLSFSIFGFFLIIMSSSTDDYGLFVDSKFHSHIESAIFLFVFIPCIVGLLMMIIGFFFWALGEIWTPYL